MRPDFPDKERGAALLTVLLLVAVMAVMAATMLDRLGLATRLAGNGSAMAQARSYAYAAETLATARIEDLLALDKAQVTMQGDWLARDFPVPIDGGVATARLADLDNCFNLNGLVTDVEGQYFVNSVAVKQFVTLMNSIGIGGNDAAIIAESAVDWIDSDQYPQRSGAEDDYYRGQDPSYLAANRLMADRSELRSVRGVTPEYYARLRPWVCTLPEAKPTILNANTLLPDQAPLLSMLFDGKLSPTAAKAVLANRPAAGYVSLNRFWADPQLAQLQPPQAAQEQVKLTSKWFLLESRISTGDIELESRSVIGTDKDRVRVLSRMFGEAS